MDEYKPELESWEDSDEFPEAILRCFVCAQRPITAEHIDIMLRGNKCVCRLCGAIHKIMGGEIGVWGFRV